MQVYGAGNENEAIKEVVLESGAKVELCLVEKDEEVTNILLSRHSAVKEKYLQIKVCIIESQINRQIDKCLL